MSMNTIFEEEQRRALYEEEQEQNREAIAAGKLTKEGEPLAKLPIVPVVNEEESTMMDDGSA